MRASHYRTTFRQFTFCPFVGGERKHQTPYHCIILTFLHRHCKRPSTKPQVFIMGRPPWTTPQQRLWLEERGGGYREARLRGTLPAFYEETIALFFQKFELVIGERPKRPKHPKHPKNQQATNETGMKDGLNQLVYCKNVDEAHKVCQIFCRHCLTDFFSFSAS